MKIIYATLSGIIAGLISWLLFQLPFIDQASPLVGSLSKGLILGVIFGGLLSAAKGASDKSFNKISHYILDCLVLGITGGVASQLLTDGLASGPDKNFLLTSSGWAVFGLFLGASYRLDSPTVQTITLCAIGGAAGGVAGIFIFNYLTAGFFKDSLFGQFLGMAVLGMAVTTGIGAMSELGFRESKATSPAKTPPAPKPIQKPAPKMEPAKPSPAGQKAESKVEPPRQLPVQPLKRWLEANFPIEKSQISVGSGPDNDIIIKAAEVEPKQALIYQEKGRYLVRNTGSSKEILVSFTGDLIQGRNLACNEFNALKDGSTIKLKGEALIFFHSSPTSVKVRYPIDKARIIIGTSQQNDIVVKDSSAGSRHAQLSWEGERGLVTDLGSNSGTYVSYTGDKTQERKVQEKNAVTNNSLIRIGNITFRVLG